jgi:hypothetical protein
MPLAALALLLSPAPLLVAPYRQLGRTPGELSIVFHAREGTALSDWQAVAISLQGRLQPAELTARGYRPAGGPNRAIVAATWPAGDWRGYALRYRGRHVFGSGLQALPRPGEAHRFAVVGDTGEDSAGQRQVAYGMFRARPAYVVITGDIVYPHGRAREYDERWFPIMNADRASRRIGAPLLRSTVTVGVTGNHDTLYRNLNRYPDGMAYYPFWRQPVNGPSTPAGMTGDATALRAGTDGDIAQVANFSFDAGPARWVVLDANPYVNWRRPELREWVRTALTQGNPRWRFVAWHQPPYHSSKQKRLEIYMRSLTDVLTEARADAVFCGHVHNYQRTYPLALRDGQLEIDTGFDGEIQTQARGTIFIVTGAGGAPLYDQRLAERPELWEPFTARYEKGYSFTLVDLSANEASFRQIDGQGREIDRFRLTKPSDITGR